MFVKLNFHVGGGPSQEPLKTILRFCFCFHFWYQKKKNEKLLAMLILFQMLGNLTFPTLYPAIFLGAYMYNIKFLDSSSPELHG